MIIDVVSHYKIDKLDYDVGNKTDSELGMVRLKKLFPDASHVNDKNFILFSTSGVHGSFTTIEEIEESLNKYGNDYVEPFGSAMSDDWHGNELTVLIICPRAVYLRYGKVRVRKDDIAWLKQLRHASHRVVQEIGM